MELVVGIAEYADVARKKTGDRDRFADYNVVRPDGHYEYI
jgi:hypothetical protein